MEEKITLIVGKQNETPYFWKINNHIPVKIGHYAIVNSTDCINQYTLVKVLGIVRSTDELAQHLVRHKKIKEVRTIIEIGDEEDE